MARQSRQNRMTPTQEARARARAQQVMENDAIAGETDNVATTRSGRAARVTRTGRTAKR